MKRSDLQLRQQVKRGDKLAIVELGLRFLSGAEDSVKSHAMALDYLVPFCAQDPGISVAIAERVPLITLVERGLRQILESAAKHECGSAAAKLGVWSRMSGHPAEAASWFANALALTGKKSLQDVFSQCEIGPIAPLLELFLSQLPDALALSAIQFAMPDALDLKAVRTRIEAIAQRLEDVGGDFSPLSVSETFLIFSTLADSGSAYASYVLGCAQAGFDCGRIARASVAGKLNYREGYARLLRASHGGISRAWHQLYLASSDYRSVLANQTAAQFFLEKAAEEQPRSQRILGAKILMRAKTVDHLVQGQKLLQLAALAGEIQASEILKTFFWPRDLDSIATTADAITRLEKLDPDLSLTLSIAAAFRLSRSEAMSLDISAACSQNVLIFTGRHGPFALPAVSPAMSALLKQVAKPTHAAPEEESRPTLGDGFARRRSVAQRALFDLYDFNEKDFFVPEGKNLAQYRKLDVWQKTNRALLKSAAQDGVEPPEACRSLKT